MEYISKKQIALKMSWCEVRPVKCKPLPAMYMFPRELQHPPYVPPEEPQAGSQAGPKCRAATSHLKASGSHKFHGGPH